jgi:hypothetical protein
MKGHWNLGLLMWHIAMSELGGWGMARQGDSRRPKEDPLSGELLLRRPRPTLAPFGQLTTWQQHCKAGSAEPTGQVSGSTKIRVSVTWVP